MIIDAPPNYLKKIEEVWMFVSVDEGGEGVCSAELIPGVLVPLLGADKARVDDLIPVARMMANRGGKKIKLIKFSVREEIMEIEP